MKKILGIIVVVILVCVIVFLARYEIRINKDEDTDKVLLELVDRANNTKVENDEKEKIDDGELNESADKDVTYISDEEVIKLYNKAINTIESSNKMILDMTDSIKVDREKYYTDELYRSKTYETMDSYKNELLKYFTKDYAKKLVDDSFLVEDNGKIYAPHSEKGVDPQIGKSNFKVIRSEAVSSLVLIQTVEILDRDEKPSGNTQDFTHELKFEDGKWVFDSIEPIIIK